MKNFHDAFVNLALARNLNHLFDDHANPTPVINNNNLQTSINLDFTLNAIIDKETNACTMTLEEMDVDDLLSENGET